MASASRVRTRVDYKRIIKGLAQTRRADKILEEKEKSVFFEKIFSLVSRVYLARIPSLFPPQKTRLYLSRPESLKFFSLACPEKGDGPGLE